MTSATQNRSSRNDRNVAATEMHARAIQGDHRFGQTSTASALIRCVPPHRISVRASRNDGEWPQRVSARLEPGAHKIGAESLAECRVERPLSHRAQTETHRASEVPDGRSRRTDRSDRRRRQPRRNPQSVSRDRSAGPDPDPPEPAMTDATQPDPDHREVGSLHRGRRAADALGHLVVPATGEALVIDCSNVTQVDTVGMAVIGAALGAHIADPRHTATIIEPTASDIWTFFSDAIGRPPAGVKWAGTRSVAARGTDVLIPAGPIQPDRVKLLLETIKTFASALGHPALAGDVLRDAATVFLDNVAKHAAGSPTPPVVCSAFEPVSRNLQLVCINLSSPATTAPPGVSDVERMVEDPDESFRSLAWLARRRRGDLEFTVSISTGTAHARHRTGGAWTITAADRPLPGLIASIDIHR